ncbi:hypothetical protein MYX78_13425, partial [Acidobacteria bacterium AH-259-G07]|nr:hypothetical protein [Acidobacteria bacterium AH-259-G07]
RHRYQHTAIMGTLTERLEVRLPGHTLQLLRGEAERRGVSLAQLVREGIDMLLREDHKARLHAAEALFQLEAPVEDWDEMKRQIEEAYLKEGGE